MTESDGHALRGRSAGYGDTGPYSAFAQHVAQVAGIYDSDDAADAIGKLRSRAVELSVGEDPAEVADAVAILAGLPVENGPADRETLYFSARLFVEAVARDRPTMMVFEDIHFSDPSLLDLIEYLASRVQDVPLLMIATSRPELLTSRPTWAGGLLTSRTVSLEPLSAEDAIELTGRLFEQRGLDGLADRAGSLAASSDGNPLFIEELTASLAERSTRDASQLPGTIRGIVAARLDALPPAERDVVLDASVVGKVFWRGVLERLRTRSARSCRTARVARAPRPDPPRGVLADQGGPAVQLQARVDPGGRLSDAATRRAASVSPKRPRSSWKMRHFVQATPTPPSHITGVRLAMPAKHWSTSSRRLTSRGAGGRRRAPHISTHRRWSSCRKTTRSSSGTSS